VRLSKQQISDIERFLGVDVDHLKKGLVKLLLIALESNEEVQLIFDSEFFSLFDELLDHLDILRIDKEVNQKYED
jgi:hypothetical protein